MNRKEKEIELVDILNILWRRKWLIMIPTLFLAVLVGFISFMLPQKWEVDALIEPSKFLFQIGDSGEFRTVIFVPPSQIIGQINQKAYDSLIAAQLGIAAENIPRIRAEILGNTNMIRVVILDSDIAKAKSILSSLFDQLKKNLDIYAEVEIKVYDAHIASIKNEIMQNELNIKDLENQIALCKLQIIDKDNEIKTQENEIKIKFNDIKLKESLIKTNEIEKNKIRKGIESNQKMLEISKERAIDIEEEIKEIKARIDKIQEQMTKVISEGKQGAESISILLYSNEIQQHYNYSGSLDEKLMAEKITQEKLNLDIKEKQELLKEVDNQIDQVKTNEDTIKTNIDNIKTKIEMTKTEKRKTLNEINTKKNEIDRVKSTINKLNTDIVMNERKKGRIEYAQLIKNPTSSNGPVYPKKILNVMIALIMGLLIFTMLSFLLEYLKKQKEQD